MLLSSPLQQYVHCALLPAEVAFRGVYDFQVTCWLVILKLSGVWSMVSFRPGWNVILKVPIEHGHPRSLVSLCESRSMATLILRSISWAQQIMGEFVKCGTYCSMPRLFSVFKAVILDQTFSNFELYISGFWSTFLNIWLTFLNIKYKQFFIAFKSFHLKCGCTGVS